MTEEKQVFPSNLSQQMLLRMLVSVFGIININLQRKALFVLSEATWLLRHYKMSLFNEEKNNLKYFNSILNVFILLVS